MSTQPSMVIHWNTVSTANRMLSKLVMPKLGPVQYSLHSVPLGHVLAGASRPQGQSTAFSPGKTEREEGAFLCFEVTNFINLFKYSKDWMNGQMNRKMKEWMDLKVTD